MTDENQHFLKIPLVFSARFAWNITPKSVGIEFAILPNRYTPFEQIASVDRDDSGKG